MRGVSIAKNARWAAGLMWIGLSAAACAQDVQPAAQPAPARLPVVLGNDGTPMVLPFQCSNEDVHWAGLTCSEEAPCPIFLELSTVDILGARVLLAGNIHTEAVTLYSVLLASEDNGHTWQEVHDRIRGAGLDRMESLGSDTAWISGQELFPLPQNPFLLITNDGGKSWRQRDILSEDSDSRFGTIQQFSFPSKDNGTLILDHGPGAGADRYALYESPNGGDSWTVKEASAKPIVAKRPAPAPQTDWRIRADAGMKSFLLEHRTGTRWSGVAAFLVRLEPCKRSETPVPMLDRP